MGQPIYLTVKSLIEQSMQGLVPNAMIPSERELALTYEVSRMTARKAVEELIKEGKLYRKDKIGTFVADQKLHEPVAELVGFTSEIASKGMRPYTKVVEYEVVEANEKIAGQLEIQPKELVHRLLRLRLANDLPMTLEQTFIPLKVIPTIPKEVPESSLYAYIDKSLDLKIASGNQTVTAIKASETVAALLKIPVNDPLLYLELRSVLMNGQVLEFVETYANPTNYEISIHSRRKW